MAGEAPAGEAEGAAEAVADEAPGGDDRLVATPEWVTYAFLAALLAVTVVVSLWEFLSTLYIVMVVCWLVVAGGLAATGLPRRLAGLDPRLLVVVLLVVALAVRWVALAQDAVLTRDIEMFVDRGDRYLAGDEPYTEDFGVNKPPSYLYLSAGLAALMGPSQLGFRAIMGLADALVAVMVLVIGRSRFSPSVGAVAGLLYAVNPISVMSVGISGHYDPVVILFALGGLYLALHGRMTLGALSLGMGFALKLYPLVFLPWLLLRERSWRNRGLMALLFALPMALSWVPVLFANPDALSYYSDWQSGWVPKKGIAYGVTMMLGWDQASEAARLAADVVEGVFLALLAVMFLDWVRRRSTAPEAHMLDWFRIVTVSYYVLYGFMFVGSVMDPRFDLGVDRGLLGATVAAVYFPLGGLGLWFLNRRVLTGAVDLGGEERLLLLGALSVALLLFSASQYNPWYLLWLLPLVLLVRSWRIRDSWNAMLLWNLEGLAVTFWPGVEIRPPPTP